MSSLSWFPLYTGDYLRDTYGLSCEEHGCYLLLLIQSWNRGPLEGDLDRLQRQTGNPKMNTLRYILGTFWEKNNSGCWENHKLELIRKKHEKSYEKRVLAGQKGGKAKALIHRGSSNAKAMLKQCSSNQNQNQKKKEEKNKQKRNLPAEKKLGDPDAAMPHGLNADAWNSYITYRKQAKLRKLQARSQEKLMRWLVDQGDAEHQAAIVEQTIRNGWQGLFELKEGKNGKSIGNRHSSAADRAAWQAEIDAEIIDDALG